MLCSKFAIFEHNYYNLINDVQKMSFLNTNIGEFNLEYKLLYFCTLLIRVR